MLSIDRTENTGYQVQIVISAIGTAILRKQIVKDSEGLTAWLQQEQRKRDACRRSQGAVIAEVQLQDHTDSEKQPGSTVTEQVVGNTLKPVQSETCTNQGLAGAWAAAERAECDAQ